MVAVCDVLLAIICLSHCSKRIKTPFKYEIYLLCDNQRKIEGKKTILCVSFFLKYFDYIAFLCIALFPLALFSLFRSIQYL